MLIIDILVEWGYYLSGDIYIYRINMAGGSRDQLMASSSLIPNTVTVSARLVDSSQSERVG